MITENDLFQLARQARSAGGDFADIFQERRESVSIVLEDAHIEKATVSFEQGVGIRVVGEGKASYGCTNHLAQADLLDLAQKVGRSCAGGFPPSDFECHPRPPGWSFPTLQNPKEMDISKKLALVHRADQAARSRGSSIRQVRVLYHDSLQEVTLVNSEGLLTQDRRISVTFSVQTVAVKDSLIQTGYEAIGGLMGLEIFIKQPPEQVAEIACQRALLMLTARPAPGGTMPVVISSEAGGTMIHEAIGHGLEADLAQANLSVFAHRLGEKVAAKIVSVVDDATLPGRRGSFAVDDEGTEAQKTVLVEEGILKGYLYDRLSAWKDGTHSTGNGRRESFRHRPIPRMTNTFIAPGKTPPAEIITSTPKGLLVKKMGGGQVNTVTGDFVFEVSEGYLIENGRIGEPVRGATLSGNGPKVLLQIDQVGSDLGFNIGTCGKDGQGVPVSDAQPTLRIPELVVGGVVKD